MTLSYKLDLLKAHSSGATKTIEARQAEQVQITAKRTSYIDVGWRPMCTCIVDSF